MQSSGAKRMRAGFAVLRSKANEDGFFRPIVREVVEKYLDCGNPRSGFALMIRCRLMRTAKRCPYPVSGVWRGAARHVLLPHQGILPVVSWQADRGVGRVDAGYAPPGCPSPPGCLHHPQDVVRKELLSPEWAERILSWRHTGFNVHSRVRAKTKTKAERGEST